MTFIYLFTFYFWPPLGIWNSQARDQIPSRSFFFNLCRNFSSVASLNPLCQAGMLHVFGATGTLLILFCHIRNSQST